MKAIELETRLISFAARVVDLVEKLPKSLVSKHLGGQLIRSGIISQMKIEAAY